MFIKKIYNYFYPSKQALRVKPWVAVKGDKTLRLNYPELNSNSIVMDMGGYEGQWASDIYSKYNSTIYIFEPYKKYAEEIDSRFEKNDKIKVFHFGLGKINSTQELNISADGSSVYKNGSDKTSKIQIVEAGVFLKEHKVDIVDLMKINIEGGEYDLLENLIEQEVINKITNIQVQFHDFAPDAFIRMKNIQNELSKTHELTYQFEFVWENWRLKSI